MAEVAEREIEAGRSASRSRCARAMQRITLEVIMRAVFGVAGRRAPRAAARMLADLLEWGSTRADGCCWPLLGPGADRSAWARSGAAARRVDELIYERDPPPPRRGRPRASATTCCRCSSQARHEDGSPMSDEELRDELMTLLVAGHETTATALAWAVERLVRHPARSERLREPATTTTSTPSSRRRCACARSAARAAPADRADGDRRLRAARGRARSRPAST